ncbi:MAG: alkaline phosphatase [Acidobacteriota bacterium]|nr:alkaline phosphatase [Acidobacteriota bacterium]
MVLSLLMSPHMFRRNERPARKRRIFTAGVALLLSASLFVSTACAPRTEDGRLPGGLKGRTQNVILLIGDGLSVAAVSAARLRKGGAEGRLHMDRMPVAGFVRTTAANDLITDSAAAATAMASGFKTNNGMIGMTPDGRKVLSIMKAAMDRGMAAGLVATSSITHATPAAFAAHVPSRNMETEIAANFISAGVNLLFGGGRRFFLPETPDGGKRDDGRNLLQEARAAGYDVCLTPKEAAAAESRKILGLFAHGAMDMTASDISLADMTSLAIEKLRGRGRGFFLMVEGSQIDWEAHDNIPDRMIEEILDFDEAAGRALDFAAKDRRTLVIATSDHETGGLVILDGTPDGGEIEVAWASTGHTGATVPLTAFGPGAEAISGFRDNTEIALALARRLGIRDFPRHLD